MEKVSKKQEGRKQRMKKIVITGPNGFVARNLIKSHCRDYDFVGILRKGSVLRGDLVSLVSEVFEYDGTVESLVPALEDAYGVIHLAAHFTTGQDLESQTKLIWDNIVFTGHIVEAIKMLPSTEDRLTPFVMAQTFTAFGPRHEESPANLYSASKLAAQYLAKGINATFLVVSDTFGSDDTRPKVHNLVRNGVITSFRSPLNQVMNLTHVSDVGDAFILAVKAANHPRAVRETTYDLLYRENRVTLEEIAELLKKEVGSSNEIPVTAVVRGETFLPNFFIKRPVREFLASELLGE